jgi:hypothetical protein
LTSFRKLGSITSSTTNFDLNASKKVDAPPSA